MTRPTLPDAMQRIAEAHASVVRVAVAAEVLAYDRTDQTVRVRPMVADPYLLEGLPAWQAVEPISGVPVAWLRAGSVTLTAGVAVGDVGLLLIRDRSHDEVDDGQAGQLDPASARRWDYSDAVYLPASIVPADPIGSTGHRSDGAPVLAMGSGLALRIGDSGASVPVARGDRTEARLDALEQWAATHIHPAGTLLDGTAAPCTGATAVVVSAPSGDDVRSGRLYTDD